MAKRPTIAELQAKIQSLEKQIEDRPSFYEMLQTNFEKAGHSIEAEDSGWITLFLFGEKGCRYEIEFSFEDNLFDGVMMTKQKPKKGWKVGDRIGEKTQDEARRLDMTFAERIKTPPILSPEKNVSTYFNIPA